MGLPVEELKESQEICFVTQGDYREFLKEHAPQATNPGTFVNEQGKELGQHNGVAFYTPGQRKGLESPLAIVYMCNVWFLISIWWCWVHQKILILKPAKSLI